MIPSTENYVEWFVCSIRHFFVREGYAFLSFLLDQATAPDFPTERLVAKSSRIVGLHFVRPVDDPGSMSRLAFEGDSDRHLRMSEAGGWLVYALPQSTDPLDQQLTHQKLLFADPHAVEFDEGGRLVPGATEAFAELLGRITEGSFGRAVDAPLSLAGILAEGRDVPVDLFLLFNTAQRVVVALKARVR